MNVEKGFGCRSAILHSGKICIQKTWQVKNARLGKNPTLFYYFFSLKNAVTTTVSCNKNHSAKIERASSDHNHNKQKPSEYLFQIHSSTPHIFKMKSCT